MCQHSRSGAHRQSEKYCPCGDVSPDVSGRLISDDLIGYDKYRAHLNFVYGVLVEQALQTAVAAEVEEGASLFRLEDWGRDR